MENITTVIDCVESKNEVHKKLYIKSGAKNFNEYIEYINSTYSDNKTYSEENKTGKRETPDTLITS